MVNNKARLIASARAGIPKKNPHWLPWAEENVRLPGSIRSTSFRISISPWLRDPLEQYLEDITCRSVTLMKPVQTGGSVAGEVAVLYAVNFWRGFVQYNWSETKRADARWNSRVRNIFNSCLPLVEKLNGYELPDSNGEWDFGNAFFRMQGTFNNNNLDSDSVSIQINEEIHSWAAGNLAKAENRSSAVWNYKRFNISNAGCKDDQLDTAFRKGTCQRWIVKCDGCGQYHEMRIRWEDRKPHLGGLRYDATGCRLSRFEYDYKRLRPTIRYQMPCGFEIHNEDIIARRRLSSRGKYSEPNNPGAELCHRSYTYQAVAVDYLDWMDLIQSKHIALKARALGDPIPFQKYVQEKECVPYDPQDVPLVGIVSVTAGLKKNREGLPQPRLRLGALDRQQGEGGISPHWWLVIRDVVWDEKAGSIRSQLVYEGKLDSDGAVIKVLDDHQVERWHVVADSGDDTTHVYLFCFEHGINAIKGSGESMWIHPNKSFHIYSKPTALHAMLFRDPMFPYLSVDVGGVEQLMPDPREPMFFLYSKAEIRERLHWMRTETIYETPDDVSEDYSGHQEAEERVWKQNAKDEGGHWEWMQHKRRNDQFVNEAYIALQVDQAGMVLAPGVSGASTENKTK